MWFEGFFKYSYLKKYFEKWFKYAFEKIVLKCETIFQKVFVLLLLFVYCSLA